MDTNFIDDLLQQAHAKEVESAKSVEVVKNVDLNFDLGHLMMTDLNELEAKQLRGDSNGYLQNLVRDNVQLFVNKMWDLETSKSDNLVVANLPRPVTRLPRAKPVPKPKQPTKWETYSKEKGINKRTKEKLVYDQVTDTWKPRYGYNRIDAQKDDWCLEIKDNEQDPNVNMFERKSEEKKERVAKNELQRLRNVARENKLNVSSLASQASGVPHSLSTFSNKDDVAKAVQVAKSSTASLGKFEQKLKNEKAPKNSGIKRKFDPNLGDMSTEKEKNLDIINKVMTKAPKLDVTKAVNTIISKEEKEISNERRGGKSPRGGKGGRKPTKSGGGGGKKTFNPKNKSKSSSNYRGKSVKGGGKKGRK